VAEDAVSCEPVSDNPGNREINREFSRFRASAAILASGPRVNPMAFQPNSLRHGTENFETRIRENFSKNRESAS
jgi:hypothetical protein